MPRKWLQGRLPNSAQLRKHLGIGSVEADQSSPGWLTQTLADPMLWHLNRRSVAGGVAVGLFVSWLPVPLQMLVAACLASVLRVHLPVSVVMVWFTNPLTLGPQLYAAWHAGSMILGVQGTHSLKSMAISDLLASVANAWPVLMVVCLFWACVSAIAGYAITQLVWRISAVRRWRKRLARDTANRTHQAADTTIVETPPEKARLF